MKILYITTIGSTMSFFKSLIKQFLDEGHTVHIATNENSSEVPMCYKEWGCTVYQIGTSRSPFNKGNLKAIKQIKELVSKEKYDIVHCHTPVAAMCTRLACRKARKNGTKVFYTAHGFHFYKSAPIKNWLLYYPVEKFCAYFTDKLITINREDYILAKNKFKAKEVIYVPGVGIDLTRFQKLQVDIAEKRQEIGVPADAILLLSVGELNENKNHETVIRAIADLDVYYMIAGKGVLKEHLQSIINEFDMSDRVKLLGYRNDVAELYQVADIYVLPSIREGLNVSVMEAMASGLPVVCSRIRGNTDLIKDYLFSSDNVEECKTAISKMIRCDISSIGRYNREQASRYSFKSINIIMHEIYNIK